ncbi:hypothetical protein KBC99_02815 [Candidatus Saccharibacteria bacterium]|nr:hypothetical protein [Candidatus Saccharibacteria bacterium]
MTRLQKERLPKKDLENLAELYNHYRLTLDRARVLKPSARILHPLPKTGEIEAAVDLLPQAAYYRQAAYGVPVRMLLLDWVIEHQLRRRIEGMNGAMI